jgi:hypothetical protein
MINIMADQLSQLSAPRDREVKSSAFYWLSTHASTELQACSPSSHTLVLYKLMLMLMLAVSKS